MNRIYRTVWNHARQCMMVASETTRSRSKASGTRKIIVEAVAGAILALGAGQAMAADVCGAGTTSITSTQATNNNCVLGAGESVNISNVGSVTVSPTGGVAGISVATGVTAGSIVNAGTITGNDNSVAFSEHAPVEIFGSLTNGFVNTGTIIRTSNQITPAVRVGSGTISSFYNSGSIYVSGDPSHGHTAIKMNGTQITGSISNSGTILAYDSQGVILDNVSVGGSIINRGILAAGSSALVISNSYIQGGIHNAGVIEAGLTSGPRIMTTGTTANGILLYSSTVMGGVTNSGTIRVASTSYSQAGIKLASSTVVGGITNSGLIEFVSDSEYAHGIYLDSSIVDGSIINSGTIHASIESSSTAYGIKLESSSITGSIVNSGLIHAEQGTDAAYGIYLSSSSVGGGITNSGRIIAEGTDAAYGVYVKSSTVATGITNSGTIKGLGSSSGVGIKVTNGGIVAGINNSGLISGTGPTEYGFGIQLNDGTLTSALINSGTIRGEGTWAVGVLVEGGSQVTGGITNSGLIEGLGSDGGAGIRVFNSTVDRIANLPSGRIVGSGGTGSSFAGVYLDGAGASVTGGITNSGTISGGSYAIYVNSGTLPNLDIVGTTSKLIGDVKAVDTAVTVKSGATFGNNNAFDVDSFTVESGGLFNFGVGPHTTGGLATSGVKVANGFTNAGIVSVAAGVAPTITGSYDQTGTYRMGLADTISNYGVLNVTGNATVAGTVDVVVSGSPAIANGTTVAGVIRSGGLTATPASITVTDNNLFYTFTADTITNPGTDLDLVIGVDSNALPNAISPNNPGATGVAQALQTIFNTGVSGFDDVFAALGTMTPAQLNEALLQLTPSLQGAGAQAGINALHSMNKIIQSRVESVQGLNSGDETADHSGWVRAFGNWGDQDDHKGVPGFESRTHGIALGMDKPINDRIRAGGLVTYARSDLKSNLGNSNVDVDTYEIAGYASYNIDPQTDINFQLDLGVNQADSERRIGFLGTRARADFDSINWHVSGGIGHLFQVSDKTNLTPSVRVDYTHVKTDGYTEKGAGVLNLHVDSSIYEELLLTVDAKLSHKLTDDGLKFVANTSAGYDFINERSQSSSTFTGGGPSFVSKGLDPSPWIYRGGLGLVKETGTGMEFSARYDAEGRSSGYLNQTASVKVRWEF